MALALYRKYRSATFSEVIGQEHVTAPLMQALSAGRINHAYLFSGPRGCGKTSSARILARSLNCAQGPTPTPCGVCDSCKDLAPNGSGSIDVIEIDAASHGGVDDARDLRERAYYAPVRDRYKVYIIDEAHMVTTQGFNALLKLVEEPPDFLIFIFATTEPDKVLQTIRSRTHHYPFRLIPPTALRAHLERICVAEGATVEPTVFPLVVRSGGGSARDSLSILDQLLAGAGPQGVTYSMAVGLLGVTDAALLDDMIDALAVGDAAGVYATIDRVVEAGHDPRRFAADLLERLRDLMVLGAVPDAITRGLIDYPADQGERMQDQSRRIGSATLVRFADITHTTLTEMRGTTSPRLMLELLCARMLLPDAAGDAAALLQRIERVERRQSMGLSVDAPIGSPPAPRAAEAEATAQPVPEPARERVADGDVEAPAPGDAPPSAPAAEAGASVTSLDARIAAAEARAAGESTTDHVAAAEAWVAERRAAAQAKMSANAGESAKPAEPEAAPAAPAEPVTAVPAEPVTPAPTVADAGADATRLRRVWPEILDQVKSKSRRTHALLDHASIGEVNGTTIVLTVSSAPIARMIGDDTNLTVIREAVTAIVGPGWQVLVGTGAPAAPTRPAPEAAAPPARPEPAAEGPSRAERAMQAAREAAAEPPPEPLSDDGVDEESDAVEGSGPGGMDPETAAMDLLQNSLGARRLDR